MRGRRRDDPQRESVYAWEQRVLRSCDPSTPQTTRVPRAIKSRKYVRITQPNGYSRVIPKRDAWQYTTRTDQPTTVEPYVRNKYESAILTGGITPDEAQAFATIVCAAFGRESVKVTVTKRLKNHSFYNAVQGIRLAAGWGQSYTVLAHEVAHALCERMRWGAVMTFQSHGPEFARVFAIILSRFVSLRGSSIDEESIVDSMRARGLNVADYGYPHPLALVDSAGKGN